MATNKNFVVKNGLEVGGDITVTGSVTSAGQTMPASDGSAGQYLQTDGSGNLSWSTVQSSIDITDGTTTDTLNTGETLTFAAGTAITTTVSDNQVEISVTGDTDDISEGSTNLYYTDARAIAAVEGATHLTIDGGTLYVDTANNYVGIGDTSPAYMLDVGGTTGGGSIAVNGTQVIDSSSEVITAQLKDSGVTAGSYGSASLVPVITVDAKGRVTAASTTSVAGVSSFTWNSTTETLNIGTADGGSFDADISGMASESYVDTAISNLIGGAPGALDTLNELAAAINDDSSYASTVTSALAGKVSKLGDSITGSLSISNNLTVDTTTLVVDATNNRVGIGTASPTELLDLGSGNQNLKFGLRGHLGQAYSTQATILGHSVKAKTDGTTSGAMEVTETNSAGGAPAAIRLESGTIEFHTASSGTDGATFDSERMIINSAGNVGIGTSSPAEKLHVKADSPILKISDTSNNYNVNDEQSAIHLSGRWYSGHTDPDSADYSDARIVLKRDNTDGNGGSALVFENSAPAAGGLTEHMRIDTNGRLCVGRTSTVGYKLDVLGDVQIERDAASGTHLIFRNTGGVKGTITTDSAGTTYNTTSDRRLKDNINTITDGKEKVLAMNPVNHTWIADPDAPAVHGFIAQEMKEIIPEAVSGDENSDEMMSMDYGRITPVIVAALQDALKEIEELKERIKTLEAK